MEQVGLECGLEGFPFLGRSEGPKLGTLCYIAGKTGLIDFVQRRPHRLSDSPMGIEIVGNERQRPRPNATTRDIIGQKPIAAQSGASRPNTNHSLVRDGMHSGAPGD